MIIGDKMSYQSLYRKYRPSKIEDVVSQEHIMEVLTKSIKKDKISHAYLFCGPRGTGKTSVAKLFAKAINCSDNENLACGICENCQAANNQTHADIVEIDAASNNGVDEIRSLIERVKYAPILGKYKVYIIDEVHMLSQGAFNALLKTLEEPPKHVVFILATTEIHKVLPTIISRCQRFDFMRIPNALIESRLDQVIELENVKAEKGVSSIIASLSGGGLRNALTILEQAIIIADDEIKKNHIYQSNGMITEDEKTSLFNTMLEGDVENLVIKIRKMQSQSVHFDKIIIDLVTNIKDSIILSHTRKASLVDQNNLKFIDFLNRKFEISERINMIDVFIQYAEKMRVSNQPEMYFDVAMLEILSEISPKENSVQNSSVDEVISEELKIVPGTNEILSTNIEIDQDLQEQNFDFEDEIETTSSEVSGDDQFYNSQEDSVITDINDSLLESNEKGLSIHQIVQLMVSADKEMRINDEEKFALRSKFRNMPQWARAARLIHDASLVLSGDFFVVITMKNEIEIREIWEDRNREALKDFSKELFSQEKMIFATDPQTFKTAIDEFIKLKNSNSLPNKISAEDFIKFQPELVTEEDANIKKIRDLFGEAFDIVED